MRFFFARNLSTLSRLYLFEFSCVSELSAIYLPFIRLIFPRILIIRNLAAAYPSDFHRLSLILQLSVVCPYDSSRGFQCSAMYPLLARFWCAPPGGPANPKQTCQSCLLAFDWAACQNMDRSFWRLGRITHQLDWSFDFPFGSLHTSFSPGSFPCEIPGPPTHSGITTPNCRSSGRDV